LRTLLIGGGHSAYFAANAIRKIDPNGKLIIIEFTSEKVEVLSKTFPFAEVILQEIDEVENYIKVNGGIIDAVIAATESDSLNLRYCKIARETVIPLAISILNNPLNREIFLKEGITYIINPYSLIPVELAEILGASINVLYKSARSNLVIASVKILDESFLLELEKMMKQSSGASAVLVSKAGEITTSLKEADLGGRLYLIGSKESIDKILRAARKVAKR